MRINNVGKYKEFLECTDKKIAEKKLGRVGYLCKGLPIYEVKTIRTSTGTLRKVKRVYNKFIIS